MRPLRCQGCGREVPGDTPAPFRCPAAGDGGDHVLGRVLDRGAGFPSDGESNPFIRYRALTHAHALAEVRGLSDAAFVALVRDLDAAVARVDGRGFVETPFGQSDALSEALGFQGASGVLVKDETGNVSGSHKGRHLMGLAILLEVHARTGLARAPWPRLAIASCGNAALAAAVLARAWGRPLDVFIPPGANPAVVERLRVLQAAVHVCHRQPGVPGDPCTHAFRRAVEQGALPFCCQGSECGLAVEGGETLAWEMVSALVRRPRSIDRLFVQVGGGALASACVQGFGEAVRLGVPVALPRLHPVQTRGAFPLRRAWELVAARIAARLRISPEAGDAALAAAIARDRQAIDEELAWASAHRARFMWPWESEPRSIAHGILDDETYDWLAVVRGTLESGGWPLVVSEERLREAHALGRRAGFRADPTGTAGLAGLLELRAARGIGPAESAAVLFTGAER